MEGVIRGCGGGIYGKGGVCVYPITSVSNSAPNVIGAGFSKAVYAFGRVDFFAIGICCCLVGLNFHTFSDVAIMMLLSLGVSFVFV